MSHNLNHRHGLRGGNLLRAMLAWITLWGAIVKNPVAGATAPSPTAFTYQGRLTEDGGPANGTYDLEAALYDSAEGDGLVAGPIGVTGVTVADGWLTAPFDFGSDAFGGGARWLEIAVRRGGDAFTRLSPRQWISATPLAMRSAVAERAETADSAQTAATAGAVAWSGLTGVPESLADGVDQDTRYTAGAGLVLGEDQRFSVAFGGGGTNALAARSDHGHFGQGWTGSGFAPGLLVHNTLTQGRAIVGIQGAGSGLNTGAGPIAGVRGEASDGDGVVGESPFRGVVGRAAGTNGLNYGVIGFSQSARGYGVYGQASQTSGTNYGGAFYSHSPDGVGVKGVAYATEYGGSYAGQFENRGYGYGIHASSSRGHAGQFDVTNEVSTGASVIARNRGRGPAGLFVVDNEANPNSALSAQSDGSGDAFKSTSTGGGDAADFTVLGSTTNRAAVRAVAYAGNRAIHAENTSSVAVHAKTGGGRAVEATATTGAALYGKATSGSGAALEIGGGAIRVVGAGVNTATAAFIHRISSSNTSFNETPNLGEAQTVINHPMCNHQPNALLFVTPRLYVGGGLASMPMLGVFYNGSTGRWVISNGSADEFGDFDAGDEINVLVILP